MEPNKPDQEQNSVPRQMPRQQAVVANNVMTPGGATVKKPRKALKIILITVGLVCGAALLGVMYILLSFKIHCESRIDKINNESANIQTRLRQSSLFKDADANTNGDCLTASGTSVNFVVTQPHPSPLAAKDGIIAELASRGIIAPSKTQEPKYLFGKNGSMSGGNTPIKQIEITYDLAGGARIRLRLNLIALYLAR